MAQSGKPGTLGRESRGGLGVVVNGASLGPQPEWSILWGGVALEWVELSAPARWAV